VIDTYSTTWTAVRDHATAAIEQSRARVMVRGVEERTADFERGRVAALQEILGLATAKPRTTLAL
jgi:hypothetical protein